MILFLILFLAIPDDRPKDAREPAHNPPPSAVDIDPGIWVDAASRSPP